MFQSIFPVGDYTQARKKCQKAELTSDLNSEEETPRRRRLPPKLLQSSDSSDSDECVNVPNRLTIRRKSNKEHVALPECPSFSLNKGSSLIYS